VPRREGAAIRDENDRALVQRARDGDAAAFGELTRRYRLPLYRLLARMVRNEDDALDLVQDVMLKAYRKLGSFREESEFKTWIYRVAVNHGTSWLRRQRLKRLIPEMLGRTTSRAEQRREILGDLIRDEERRRLAAAMEKLPPRQRAAIHLRIVESEPFVAIAAIMGGSVGTAKANFFHGVRKLQRELGDSIDELQRTQTS
jgi:RNA polymerase sigma-70 factor, ECF subfamily